MAEATHPTLGSWVCLINDRSGEGVGEELAKIKLGYGSGAAYSARTYLPTPQSGTADLASCATQGRRRRQTRPRPFI